MFQNDAGNDCGILSRPGKGRERSSNQATQGLEAEGEPRFHCAAVMRMVARHGRGERTTFEAIWPELAGQITRIRDRHHSGVVDYNVRFRSMLPAKV